MSKESDDQTQTISQDETTSDIDDGATADTHGSDSGGQREIIEVSIGELSPKLQEAVGAAGWSELMPVQARAIPPLLAGRDVMVQSRTGSGKTGAFLLPALEQIDPNKAACQVLVLAPTRELAQQVANEASILGQAFGVRSAAVYGGVKYGPQLDALRKGAHMVIGTPGRILDHLLRRNLRLDDLRMLVFDEADRMLSMGFYPDMREIQRYLPARKVQTAMFSATFPTSVINLSRVFLTEPEFISLSRDNVHVTEAQHQLYITPPMKKDRSLVRLIEVENPTSAIIFCNTKKTVRYVTIVLQRFGYDADEISSDLNQKARDSVLDRVRAGTLRFLVATDVAARGIDVPEISHVFQYEPPEDAESYIHRAGRTARAGATGTVISLAENVIERIQLERIAKRYGIDMEELPLPSDEDVTSVVSARVITLLEGRLRARDNLKTERMQRFVPLISELTQSEEGELLLAMLVDDFYQALLHAPPMLPQEEAQPQPRYERKDEKKAKSGSSKRRRKRRRSKGGGGAEAS